MWRREDGDEMSIGGENGKINQKKIKKIPFPILWYLWLWHEFINKIKFEFEVCIFTLNTINLWRYTVYATEHHYHYGNMHKY